ncbi:hypothetical protein AD998_10650 [bacterium 336/3]|nr:hypothetical protein AD998_10650 [bacterium 336/3]
MMEETHIDVICPKCSKKAAYYAERAGTYIQYPKKEGIIKCSYCGLNKNHVFSNKDYFYKINIGKRFLFARNMRGLNNIKFFFENNLKFTDPDDDFPKEFYKKKKFIINEIQKIINNSK